MGVSLSRGLLRIRWSVRAFARAPGLTFVLVLTIALGVGSNGAVYGFLEGLTHPVSPMGGDKRIVSIFGQARAGQNRSGEALALSPDEYRLLESSHGVFEWIGAAQIRPAPATIDGHPEIAIVAAVTPDLVRALAMPLDKGVVISERVRENEFKARENVVGSQIRIDDADFGIAGVAPKELDGLYSDQKVDLWIEAKPQDPGGDGEKRSLWVLGRLRPGVSIGEAETALHSEYGSLRELSLAPYAGLAPKMMRGLARVAMFLNFTAGAVFFIACIDVASFLLGRALKRSHETSLRVALGATRAELFRGLFADSVVISVGGGIVGLLLGILTAHVLPDFLFEEDAARLRFAPHLVPILTASTVCVAITVACGMLPMLGTVADRPWTVLQRETGSPSKTIQRLRSALVVGQITACCILVICTALLLDGLHSALKTGAGQRLGNPILLTVQAPTPDGPEPDTSYFSNVEQKAILVAGLQPVAWTARLPGNEPMWRTFRIQQQSSEYRDVVLDIAWLTPASIQSLDSQPVAGRMFGINDQRYRVAIVNEEAAEELFGRQTAGMVIRDAEDMPIEVIGVVRKAGNKGTSEQGNSGSAGQQERPTIYYGYLNQPEAPKPIRDAHFRVPVGAPEEGIELSENVVSGSYFGALDMPVIVGQRFSEGPIAGQGRVAVINQEAADLYFGGNALGAGIIDEGGVRSEIVGVVKSQVLGTFEQHAEAAIYFPMWQDSPARMTLILRNGKRNSGLNGELRKKIEKAAAGSAGKIGISTLDAQLAQSGLAALRIATLIGGVSALTGLFLSLLGLLGAQGDAEVQRQRDRAIRIALGAQRWRVVLLVMRGAGLLALAGTAAGTLLAFAMLRVMLADITGISSPPMRVWLIAPLVPAAAVMMASVFPARRASVVSPAEIMKDS